MAWVTKTPSQKSINQDSETAQPVKVLAARPVNLSSVTGTHVTEEENWLLDGVLLLVYVHALP